MVEYTRGTNSTTQLDNELTPISPEVIESLVVVVVTELPVLKVEWQLRYNGALDLVQTYI
jgi:hypothetical protein